MVLSKPNFKAVLREGSATEYGTAEPTLLIDAPEEADHRLRMALLHRVAAAVYTASSPRDNWSVRMADGWTLMGAGEPLRAYIKLGLDEGTFAEAQGGMAVLGAVISALYNDKWIAVQFQGAQLPEPDPSPYGRAGMRKQRVRR